MWYYSGKYLNQMCFSVQNFRIFLCSAFQGVFLFISLLLWRFHVFGIFNRVVEIAELKGYLGAKINFKYLIRLYRTILHLINHNCKFLCYSMKWILYWNMNMNIFHFRHRHHDYHTWSGWFNWMDWIICANNVKQKLWLAENVTNQKISIISIKNTSTTYKTNTKTML